MLTTLLGMMCLAGPAVGYEVTDAGSCSALSKTTSGVVAPAHFAAYLQPLASSQGRT